MEVTGERFPDMKDLKNDGGRRIVNEDNTHVTVRGTIVNGNHCQIDADACIINGDDCLVNGDDCIGNGDRGRMWGNKGIINGSGWVIRGAVAIQNDHRFTIDGGCIHTVNASNSNKTFNFTSNGFTTARHGSSVFFRK